MANRLLSADVNVSFEEGTADDIDIKLEPSGEWTRRNPFEGWRAIREFPYTTGVTRRASVGTIEDVGDVFTLTRNEFVQFDGSDEAEVAYPVDSFSITTNVEFSFTPTGGFLSPGALHFTFTRYKKSIKANRPFIGAIQVQYSTRYRLLAYKPDGGIHDGITGGDAFYRKFGAIISVKNTASAVLQIEPGEANDMSLRKEIYRVVSEVMSNDSGTWEKYPTFDSGGFWAATGAPVLGDPLMRHERPHEIGWLIRASGGEVQYETRTVFPEQGATEIPTFKPILTCRIHPASEFVGTPWEDAYGRVDIDALKDEISSHWVGYTLTFA